MKRFCLVSLLMLLAFNVRGQGKNQLNDVIISSIKSYMYEDSINYNKIDKYSITYNILVDGLPRSFPYDSLRNVYFYTHLNPSSLIKSKRREFKKGTSILKISIRALEDKIIIIIFPQSVKLKRNIFHFRVSDWVIYTYAYSQEQKKWILIKKKEGGI